MTEYPSTVMKGKNASKPQAATCVDSTLVCMFSYNGHILDLT